MHEGRIEQVGGRRPGGLDRLVAFSCKRRGFCPSCGGRRTAERAAHLVDHVFPNVPVRQWVLSLPYRLRYRLAWDQDLCRAVGAVYMRAVMGWLRRRAQLDDVVDGCGGAVAVLQRFGGALNLNVHIHALVLDGVFTKDQADTVAFHPTPSLTALDVAEVLATLEPRIARLLNRRGIGDRDDSTGEADAWTEEAPVLAGRPRCKASWRWGASRAPASVVWVTRPGRHHRAAKPEVCSFSTSANGQGPFAATHRDAWVSPSAPAAAVPRTNSGR